MPPRALKRETTRPASAGRVVVDWTEAEYGIVFKPVHALTVNYDHTGPDVMHGKGGQRTMPVLSSSLRHYDSNP